MWCCRPRAPERRSAEPWLGSDSSASAAVELRVDSTTAFDPLASRSGQSRPTASGHELDVSGSHSAVGETAMFLARAYRDVNAAYPASRYDVDQFAMTFGDLARYQIHWRRKVGEGSFGNVYMGTDTSTGANVVVKAMKAEKATARRLAAEVLALTLVRGGPNIVQLLDVLRDERTRTEMLVFEHVESPQAEKAYRRFDDLTARQYMYDLLCALDFAHSQGLMHLDIKPNNTLYNPETRELRLIDWGFAAPYFPGVKLTRWPGTRTTKAPELFLHYRFYDYAADMWSVGCMLGSVLLRRFPMFPCERHLDKVEWNKNQLYAIVRLLGTEDYVAFCRKYGAKMPFLKIFPPKYFKYNNCRAKRVNWATLVNDSNRALAVPDGLDLLDRVLVSDPELRITAAEALAHPYFDPVRRAPLNSARQSLFLGDSGSLATGGSSAGVGLGSAGTGASLGNLSTPADGGPLHSPAFASADDATDLHRGLLDEDDNGAAGPAASVPASRQSPTVWAERFDSDSRSPRSARAARDESSIEQISS